MRYDAKHKKTVQIRSVDARVRRYNYAKLRPIIFDQIFSFNLLLRHFVLGNCMFQGRNFVLPKSLEKIFAVVTPAQVRLMKLAV